MAKMNWDRVSRERRYSRGTADARNFRQENRQQRKKVRGTLAKYDGVCPNCSNPINAGTSRIVYDGVAEGFVHSRCVTR